MSPYKARSYLESRLTFRMLVSHAGLRRLLLVLTLHCNLLDVPAPVNISCLLRSRGNNSTTAQLVRTRSDRAVAAVVELYVLVFRLRFFVAQLGTQGRCGARGRLSKAVYDLQETSQPRTPDYPFTTVADCIRTLETRRLRYSPAPATLRLEISFKTALTAVSTICARSAARSRQRIPQSVTFRYEADPRVRLGAGTVEQSRTRGGVPREDAEK